jgi:aspartate carbamoyltransferase catalytic subunit
MEHLISIDDVTPEEVDEIIERATVYKMIRQDAISWSFVQRASMISHMNKLLISVFYAPSTRTRFSFEAAMSYLGGHVIGTENAAEFSSVKKGESIADNFRVISGFGDVIVGRFRNEGDARIAADASLVPVINGGDGMGEHPSQALIDYYTIRTALPEMPSWITFVGDNRRSRTVKSLCRLLTSCTRINEIVFVSPPGLEPDPEFIEELEFEQVSVSICTDIREEMLLETTPVVYVTRSQNECSDNQFDGSQYAFTPDLLKRLNPNAIIMHPLPRNSELPVEIDADPRAKYFEQARNGLFVRMALLEKICS